MIDSKPLQNFSLRKRRLSNLIEIETILDLLPEAALLVDVKDNRIILANSKLTQISSWTRSDLLGMKFDDLFSIQDIEEPPIEFISKIQGRTLNWDLSMTKRGGFEELVQATPTSIDPQGARLIVILEPVSKREQRLAEVERQRNQWEGLQTLVNASQQSNLNIAFDLVLNAAHTMTGASYITIYQVDGHSPTLIQTAAIENEKPLPQQIQPYDLIALEEPILWTPGKRTISNLHRFARASNISYVASAPIGQENAAIGILVIADDKNSPAENILDILGVLTNSLNSIIQGSILIKNLRDDLTVKNTSSQVYSVTTEEVLDSVVILTPELKIQELNPAAESALGYESNEVAGQEIDDILISTDNLHAAILSSSEKAQKQCLEGINLFRRDGRSFLANVLTAPILDGDDITNIIIVFQDLSELEQYRLLNQELEKRAILGEVTASFAHEVRNPINNISTGLQLLAINLPEDDHHQETIERLKNDCERLAELVKSSLLFVRPMEYTLAPIHIDQMLQNLLSRTKSRMDRSNIEYQMQVENDISTVEGDYRALEQVFTNLIINAIQAMEDNGGVLAFKLKPIQDPEGTDYIEISVSDTGPGIPDEIINRIFEPFYTTKENGTGLGLAIVKRIITAHRGVVNVTSMPGGTIFQIRLPTVSES
jgi:PAS domain S-box-containing protein